MEALENNHPNRSVEVAVVHFAGHNFFGHLGDRQCQKIMREMQEIECNRRSGVRGDLFLDIRKNTRPNHIFAQRGLRSALQKKIGQREKSLAVFRRNAIVTGVELNELMAKSLKSRRNFAARRNAACYWMDQAFAPGAFIF